MTWVALAICNTSILGNLLTAYRLPHSWASQRLPISSTRGQCVLGQQLKVHKLVQMEGVRTRISKGCTQADAEDYEICLLFWRIVCSSGVQLTRERVRHNFESCVHGKVKVLVKVVKNRQLWHKSHVPLPWILTTPNYGAHLAVRRKLELPHGITEWLQSLDALRWWLLKLSSCVLNIIIIYYYYYNHCYNHHCYPFVVIIVIPFCSSPTNSATIIHHSVETHVTPSHPCSGRFWKSYMWDHVGPPFSDGILRGSTIFNAFYVKVQSVLRSSARFCKVLPGCVVPTHPVLRLRRIERSFSEVQQIKKSRTQVCQSQMCKENYWTWPPWPFGMRYGRLGCAICDMDIYGCSHHTNCRWATSGDCDNLIFTSPSQPKIPLICIPNCKIDEFLVQSISESKHPMVQNKQQTSGLQCRQPCFLTSLQACAEQSCPWCDATDLSRICPVHLHRTSTCLTYLDVLQACEFGLYHDIFNQT